MTDVLYVGCAGDVEIVSDRYSDLLKKIQDHEIPNYKWKRVVRQVVEEIQEESVVLEAPPRAEVRQVNFQSSAPAFPNVTEQSNHNGLTPDGRPMRRRVNRRDNMDALKAMVS